MFDPHLNSVHLDLSRRDDFRRAREMMLSARGVNTLQLDGKQIQRLMHRGETIADPPSKCGTPVQRSEYVLVDDKRVTPLKIGVNTVGRLPDNDVVLIDPHSSRRHCSLLVHTNERCELHDLASKNGTYLNGQRLTCPTILRPNDEIRVGDLKLTFMNANALTHTNLPHTGNTSIIKANQAN